MSGLNNSNLSTGQDRKNPGLGNAGLKNRPGTKGMASAVRPQGSFAQQMATMKSKGVNAREVEDKQPSDDENSELNAEDIATEPEEALEKKLKDAKKKELAAQSQELSPEEAEKLKKEQNKKLAMQKQDAQRAAQESRGQDSAKRQQLDEDSHFVSKETTKADIAQEKQEQINAAKEGNQGQQQENQEEQKKKQLANWELLAPQLMEDGKNKAIRLDIPDVDAVKTIIVRMKGGKIDMQAIGSKDLVKIFKSKEGMIRSALGKKNVKMGKLQVFDIEALQARG